MEAKKIQDTTLIGSWEEVQGIPASSITKNEEDVERLDGLIIKGYETKFGEGTNENGERYSKDAIDDFIKRYFVDKKLNMPVDIQHDGRPEYLAGRVIYIESNTTGFYFVAYIPRTYIHYDMVRNLLAEKILQGFSKMGWASEYECIYKKDGSFDYELIKKIDIISMSLVATPANGVAFEDVKEIKNATRFAKIEEEQADTLADMFN